MRGSTTSSGHLPTSVKFEGSLKHGLRWTSRSFEYRYAPREFGSSTVGGAVQQQRRPEREGEGEGNVGSEDGSGEATPPPAEATLRVRASRGIEARGVALYEVRSGFLRDFEVPGGKA